MTDEEHLQARRRTVWRAAERTLWRRPTELTMGERLAELTAGAGEVSDLDAFPDWYGSGVVEELERRVAGLLGLPAAVYFPTGTMAQQVALRCWAERTGSRTVALHPLAHPELHERGAFGAVSGLRTVHPTAEPRLPTAEEIRGFEEPFGALMLELPLREAGFVLPSWEELTEVTEAARERDAVVHFDGARLWECPSHFGRPLHEIAALADSVYVSFYKSLGGLAGAALAGPEDVVAEARAWRHRYGGLAFQQFPAVLSALIGLERELPKLPSYAAQAKVVAAAMTEAFGESPAPWFRVHPGTPHTHQFLVWLPYPPEVLMAASLALSEETGTTLFHFWSEESRVPGISASEVTVAEAGLEWTEADVKEAVAEFMVRVLREAAAQEDD
ncbi:threonine aldolase family protein [Streptomyces tsukubensis]